MDFFGSFIITIVVGNTEGISVFIDINNFYRPKDFRINFGGIFFDKI